MRKIFVAAVAAVCLSAPAQGFGLRSHLWIAEQVYNDILDCHLTIAGEDFEILPETCTAIRDHKAEFLAGALGPDVFPDLVVGQSVVHPGVEGSWQANQWLGHLLTHAESGEEIAFAWGYAMHFAGDTFAHSYVNNYSGDVFELFKGGSNYVELRHFRLEKYIDQFLVYRADPAALRVPEAFLARQLVQFEYPAYRPAGARAATAHLRSVRLVLEIAREARDRAPELEQEAHQGVVLALRDLGRLEGELGRPESGGVPIDRRSEAFLALSAHNRRRLVAAHTRYEAAVDREREEHALVVFTTAWVADIEYATQRYIEASLAFGRNMILASGTDARPYADREGMVRPYRRWLACYADVLRGNPRAAGDAICARLDAMGVNLNLAEAALRLSATSGQRNLYYRLLRLDRAITEWLTQAAIRVAGIADPSTSELLRELTDPAQINRDALNDVFRVARNGQLRFQCAADWIDADLGLRPRLADGTDAPCDHAPRRDSMDPMQFLPLRYAVTLAKLSLLDQARVRDLASRFGGNAGEIRMTDYRRYSVLLDTIRSIDGNQQWQSRSMPFPRATAYAHEPAYRSAGYGPNSAGAFGFPLYQTEGLRSGPFTRLFPEPYEGSILRRREMQPSFYPFVPCPGDPLRGPSRAGTIVCDDRRN